MTTFSIIGYGEVGSRFATDLAQNANGPIRVFDIDDKARCRAADAAHVTVTETAADAACETDVVVVSVTPNSVLDAVESLMGSLGHAPLVLDVNSVSPGTKAAAFERIELFGGRYVEAAITTSIPAHGLRSPMLLGGPHMRAFAETMAPFAMALTAFSPDVGRASSVKMCRSILIKGLEALVIESMLSARHYGVENEVLASLVDTLPHKDWSALARYLIGRSLVHGRRRSEEMFEAAQTVRQAGFEPLLSAAIAERQVWSARQGSALQPSQLSVSELGPLLDAVRQACSAK